MLSKPPSESEWLSWIYSGTAALLIFLTIPFARAAQAIVVQYIGRDFFLCVVGLAAVSSGHAAWVNLRRRRLGPGAYIYLLGIGLSFAIYTYSLRGNPE